MKTVRVWGIYYKIRVSPKSKWTKYVGPVGVFALSNMFQDKELVEVLRGRPFFFRTRALARKAAKELNEICAESWQQCAKYVVRPIELGWKSVGKKAEADQTQSPQTSKVSAVILDEFSETQNPQMPGILEGLGKTEEKN